MPPRSHPPLPSTGLSATSCLLTADLAALGHGDHAALGRIHHITRRLLWRTIERIVDTPAIADEVLQDTFIKIWMTADRFDPRKASPWTWMTAIARHAAIDRLRHHRRRVATVSLDALHDEEHAEDGAASPTPAPADIDGSRGDPLHALYSRQLREEMEKLPASQRQCMALAYDLGLSHAEVAAHLALPLGTVKCRLRRAHLALRQRLEPQVH